MYIIIVINVNIITEAALQADWGENQKPDQGVKLALIKIAPCFSLQSDAKPFADLGHIMPEWQQLCLAPAM